mgnify:CR=1 FL=1
MEVNSLYSNTGKLLDGLKLIKPRVLKDNRGFFVESWNKKSLINFGLGKIDFVQDNHSLSSKGVFRGFHYQVPPHQQLKLVRCITGEIFDIVIDIRQSSSSFKEWVGVHLSSKNFNQLWIPPGFAHGFLTLSDQAELIYKVSDYWDKDSERTISWKDPSLSIEFPFDGSFELSQKDDNAPFLTELKANDLF